MTTAKTPIVIYWFRHDLRLADNPALRAAAAEGEVLPIFIQPSEPISEQEPGAASRWWLHHSLAAIDKKLKGNLRYFSGNPSEIIPGLCRHFNITAIFLNQSFDPWQQQADDNLTHQLNQQGITVHRSNGSLLWNPWDCFKADNSPYRVFTPFFRNCSNNNQPPRHPLPLPKSLSLAKTRVPDACTLDSLSLRPQHRWCNKLSRYWTVGEIGAQQRLQIFLDSNLHSYKEGRDYPAQPSTSRLSAALHFGELSPNQLWYAVENHPSTEDSYHFRRQLVWREFSYNLLFCHPLMGKKNLQEKFGHFDWLDNPELLQRWQRGLTGYPLVDAGMRELWQTGTMHNRVRMVVGSFLVKNLRLHWRHGERWFRDCLLDADSALNSANWQWVAGCGTDATPYFRIFNPTIQAKKFDSQGEYIRQFIPELAELPLRYLFTPWTAPDEILSSCGIELGENYPAPIVDLKVSRQQALNAYSRLKDHLAVS